MTSRAAQLVKTLNKHAQNTQCFERVLDKVKLLPSPDGQMVGHLTVSEEHLNVGGTLHGGLIGTLIDYVSTCALLNKENGKRGISVDLNVNFMKGAKVGDNVEIEAKTVKSGRTIAFLAVELRNQETKQIYATGSHTKFVA